MGQAPFRVIGVEEKVFRAFPGDTGKAGGTCDFCGTGIRWVYTIESADGKRWGIGCDCVRHVGDSGLKRQATEMQRGIDRKNRMKKAIEKAAILKQWWAEHRAELAEYPHPFSQHAKAGKTYADYIDYCLVGAAESSQVTRLIGAKNYLGHQLANELGRMK